MGNCNVVGPQEVLVVSGTPTEDPPSTPPLPASLCRGTFYRVTKVVDRESVAQLLQYLLEVLPTQYIACIPAIVVKPTID